MRQHLPPLDIPAERESEIVDELALQLEAAYDAAISRGASHEDALRAAHSEIPDWRIFAARVVQIERSSPIATRSLTPAPVTSGGAMRGFTRDLGLAARGLLRAPAFATVSLLTLTLGLGLAAAAFAVVDAVLVRPLPYADSDRLVLVHATVPPEGRDTPEITFPDSRDLAAETRVFERVASVLSYAGTNTSIDPPGRIQGFFVSSPFFDVFGLQPALGRAFSEQDGSTGQAAVAMISHGYWQRLGSPADIIGRTITLDERPRTIVGVAPAGFSFELIQQPTDVFIPIGGGELGFLESRAVRAFRVVGRLAPGVSIEQANAAASTVAARLQQAYPDTNLGRDLSVRSLNADLVSNVTGVLSLVSALVALVLVVAAVNLTSLLLARAIARAREMAVRLALGANRWRLVREAFAEGLVLTACGAAGGLLLAEALLAGLSRTPGLTLPRLAEVVLGPRTIAGVSGVAVIIALAVALIPLFLMHRLQSTGTLRTGHETADRRTGRIRGLLVAGQTSLAFMLLASAALLAVSLQTLLSQPAGFDTRDVMTMRVAVPAARYRERDTTVAFYRGFLDTLRSQPGVRAAGIVSALPLAGGASSALLVEGRESTPEAMRPTVGWQWTSRDYFAAMGMPMVRGRDFTDEDLARPGHVTIVNETLARAQFPGEDPIGKRVYYGPVPPGGVTDWHVIVGVVGDVRHRTLEQPPDARAYDLFGQHWGRNVALAVRAPDDPARVGRAVRTLLAERDPLLALFAVQTTADLVSASTATRRLLLWLVAGFSIAGLAVALVGVYGTVSYMVAQRTRELGVRIALGASAPDIRRLVLGYGFRIAIAGILFGLAGAWAMRGFIESQLFGVHATSAPILAATAFGLLLAAIAACLVPAQRAIDVDPARSLKAE